MFLSLGILYTQQTHEKLRNDLQFASTPGRWVQSHFGWYWPHGGSLPWDVSQARSDQRTGLFDCDDSLCTWCLFTMLTNLCFYSFFTFYHIKHFNLGLRSSILFNSWINQLVANFPFPNKIRQDWQTGRKFRVVSDAAFNGEAGGSPG